MSHRTNQSAGLMAAPSWMRLCKSLSLAMVIGCATVAMGQSAGTGPARTAPARAEVHPPVIDFDSVNKSASAEPEKPIGPRSTDSADATAPLPTEKPLSRTAPANSNGFDFWRIFTALGIVLGLIVIVRKGAKYLMGPSAPGRSNKTLQVITRTTLGPRQQLMLIQVGRRLVLAAHTASNISPLCEITDPSEVTELLGSIRAEKPDSITKAFSGLFKHEEQKITAAAAKAANRDDENVSPAEQARQAKLGLKLDIRDDQIDDASAEDSSESTDDGMDPSPAVGVTGPVAATRRKDSADIARSSTPASGNSQINGNTQARLDVIEGAGGTWPDRPITPPTVGADVAAKSRSAKNAPTTDVQQRLQNADQTAAERAQQVAAAALASMRSRQGAQPAGISPAADHPSRPSTDQATPSAADQSDLDNASETTGPTADSVAARRRDPLDSTQDQINDLMERLRTMRSQFKS